MDDMEDFRSEIRRIDDEIMELVGERLKISKRIGALRGDEGKAVRDIDIEMTTLERFRSMGDLVGMSRRAAESLCHTLIEESIAVQSSTSIRDHSKRRIVVVGGQGQMGKAIGRLLKKNGHDIGIIDPAASNRLTLEDASDADVVIVSVPISSVSGILVELDRICRDDATIFDISSLKSPFIGDLKALASRRKVCSVHPMFGPSVRSMHGRNFIICDCGSSDAVDDVLELFDGQGADIKIMPVDDHDGYMSYVLGLSHVVNIAFFTVLERSGIPFKELCSASSTTFDKMTETFMSVALEDPHLYYEIQNMNSGRDLMLQELRRAISDISDAAVSGNPEDFVEIMLKGRAYLEK